MLITNCLYDFLFYGYPCMKIKETVMLECRKNMEFDLMIWDIPIWFEMLISNGVHVI